MWRGVTGDVEYLLNVMWPLTPFHRDNGATLLWPDSHGRALRSCAVRHGSKSLIARKLHNSFTTSSQPIRYRPHNRSSNRGSLPCFLDVNTGYEIRGDLNLYRTTDGGETWQGVIAKLSSGNPQVKFADHQVGWSLYGDTWAYSVDGGKRWTTRQVRFPAAVTAFCMPTSDRGYAVGDHGMIFRYRVVPIDYTAKGMIEAPMMPVASEVK